MLGIVLLTLLLPSTLRADRSPPEFTINLDLPPEERWNEVTNYYKMYTPGFHKAMAEWLPTQLHPITMKLGRLIHKYLPDEMKRELNGIASTADIDIGDLTLSNVMYDLETYSRRACTSIVAQDGKGNLIHGRNLDWDLGTELLINTTFIAHFQKNNKTQYSAPTFAFYTGIMTGQKPNVFTISVNQREVGTGGIIRNIIMAMLTQFKHPVGQAVRFSLEHSSTYEEAISYLSKTHLIAPVYFIVGGVKPNEGAVITRSRLFPVEKWALDSAKGRWYVLETNYDRWKKPNDDRRSVAQKAMNETQQSNINPDAMFNVLSTFDVENSGTIYTTVISAKSPDFMKKYTFIRNTDTVN